MSNLMAFTNRFVLRDDFVEPYKTRPVDWGPLGYVTYKRTYARPLPGGGTEEWWQTVRRVVEGTFTLRRWHYDTEGLTWDEVSSQYMAEDMYRAIFEMRFLPPGRGLWSMGTETIEKIGVASAMNCGFISTDSDAFSRPFAFVMDMSMLGVGCGFDTRGAGWGIVEPELDPEPHVVADSRQGWVELVARVLDAYVGSATMPAEIDYSLIRPAGAPIAGFGGVAAGPEPLMMLIERIKGILDPLVGTQLTTTAIVDLMDVIGVCVVSGNVRRSALIALGDADDAEFRAMKDPATNGAALMSHRWASNNTVYAEVGQDYTEVAAQLAKNGEPGLYWLDNARDYGRMADGQQRDIDRDALGLNPCGEMTLASGELCCLVETFPARHESYIDYMGTLLLAYEYGKTVTLGLIHDREANVVQRRNRRLGISQSGVVQAINRHGFHEWIEWCDRGYAYLRTHDRQTSRKLNVPASVKLTTIKPAGTTSLLPGATPGIHHEHAEHYFRTIRVAKNSQLVEPLRAAGHRIEDDLYDPSSLVVYFPVRAQHYERSKDQVSLWEQLEIAALAQEHWSDNGVSATITFRPDEAPSIARALSMFDRRLKAVSFLPLSEHGYAQAPYITIDRATYEQAAAALRPLDLSGNRHEIDDAYCDGDRCVVPGSPSDVTSPIAIGNQGDDLDRSIAERTAVDPDYPSRLDAAIARARLPISATDALTA